MENQLAIRNSNQELVRNSIPSEHEMMVFHAMSEQAITSKMYANNYKDKSAVLMIMLSARELGIPPMQALNGGLNLIQGKVEISARMMNALIRKAGHQLKVQECTNTHCVLIGKRGDTGESQTSSFSIAEAQLAGLIKTGGGWTKWPKDMCFARALSRLARQLFSDVIGIGYVEGEISQSDSKPIQCDSIIEDDFLLIDPTEKEDEQTYIDKFLYIFDKEDKFLAMEYLKIVQAHFEFTLIETIKKLLDDQSRLLDKFKSWKKKNHKMESNEE